MLELALREALSFGVDVGGEHVLLGMFREPACVGARILQGFGIDEEHLRREVISRSLP